MGSAYQYANIIPRVEYSGESILSWGCFAALGHEQLGITVGKMNFQDCKGILQDNTRVAVSCSRKMTLNIKVKKKKIHFLE